MPMPYLIIGLSAIAVAVLTLFSGFGLGTLLMPVFAVFYPIQIAVAATAIVHLANNIFKAVLIGRRADLKIVSLFAIPAALAAALGALLLNLFSAMAPIAVYDLGSHECIVSPSGLVVGIFIIAFALLDLIPGFGKFSVDKKFVPLGGILSGFFGGLSGHQGALRTVFLVRLGLTKEAFVGTVVMCAVIVDVFRIVVYGSTFIKTDWNVLVQNKTVWLIVTGIAAAFLGSFIGSRLLKKITMGFINKLVGIMLILFGLSLALGII